MNESTTTSPRLVSINRRQSVLHSVDVDRLIGEDHRARLIRELVGRLDLGPYHAQIASVEGHAGREHTNPQLLISLWLYVYSRGISSAREISRQCGYEPGVAVAVRTGAHQPSDAVGFSLRVQRRSRRPVRYRCWG
jgi:hypothetical protein